MFSVAGSSSIGSLVVVICGWCSGMFLLRLFFILCNILGGGSHNLGMGSGDPAIQGVFFQIICTSQWGVGNGCFFLQTK